MKTTEIKVAFEMDRNDALEFFTTESNRYVVAYQFVPAENPSKFHIDAIVIRDLLGRLIRRVNSNVIVNVE